MSICFRKVERKKCVHGQPKSRVKTIHECKICNYTTCKKQNYNTHIKSLRHIKNTTEPEELQHICKKCNRKYMCYSGLWRHNKTCIAVVTDDLVSEDHVFVNKVDKLQEQLQNLTELIIATSENEDVSKTRGKITYLCKKQNNKFMSVTKKNKKNIPLALKRNVWNKYVGEEIGKTLCLCCKLTDITQMNFSCGHIISESNGGEINLNNLKPICVSCNSSMGTQNMDEFIQNYGL